jgi:hypothetical protein
MVTVSACRPEERGIESDWGIRFCNAAMLLLMTYVNALVFVEMKYKILSKIKILHYGRIAIYKPVKIGDFIDF